MRVSYKWQIIDPLGQACSESPDSPGLQETAPRNLARAHFVCWLVIRETPHFLAGPHGHK
jgi:hypothetical protein